MRKYVKFQMHVNRGLRKISSRKRYSVTGDWMGLAGLEVRIEDKKFVDSGGMTP
jgi:hypothetical protein